MADETMPEEPKTKTRQRLTVTAMYEAICDLHFAIAGEEARQTQEPPMLSVTSQSPPNNTYAAALFERRREVPFQGTGFIEEGVHPDGIEEAVATLLANMQERFEAKRKAVLADLDSVMGRHHGALRGARSKIKGKKT